MTSAALALMYEQLDADLFLSFPAFPNQQLNKDQKNRLKTYVRWLKSENRFWLTPELADYRDYLIKEVKLAPFSVKAHLSTVRGRYRDLMKSGYLEELFPLSTLSDPKKIDEREKDLQELVAVIQQAIDPAISEVEAPRPTGEQVRLTRAQASELLRMPGLNNLQGLRDTAIIGLMLTTGIRAPEVSALTVSNIRADAERGEVLHVPDCLGCKERYIPYGADWILPLIDTWMREVAINDGYIFRPFFRSSRSIRKTRLSPSAIELIVESYPLFIDDQRISVTPLVLRRTFASQLFRADVALPQIAEYLGSSTLTASQYISANRIGSDAYDESVSINQLYDFDPEV